MCFELDNILKFFLLINFCHGALKANLTATFEKTALLAICCCYVLYKNRKINAPEWELYFLKQKWERKILLSIYLTFINCSNVFIHPVFLNGNPPDKAKPCLQLLLFF